MPLHPPKQTQSADTIPDASVRIEGIRQAIARQSFKTALDRAKTLHKQSATSESQAVLLEAYTARVQGMIAKNLLAEAQALAELVLGRFPEAAGAMEELLGTLAAKTGDLSRLLAPLAESPSPREWPQSIKDTIRRNVSDPAAIANCEALPPSHPLRVAAAALVQALAAVTSGPVDEAALTLPECPRKSPLADWKILIRAIAALHEGRDQECRQLLDAVHEESAGACLVPVIRSMLEERLDPTLSPIQRQLVQRVGGPSLLLRSALDRLDEAMAEKDDRPIASRLKEALHLCHQAWPERLARLKQHLFVKLDTLELLDGSVMVALKPFPTADAYFWRLFARGVEQCGDQPFACFVWDRFRRAAVNEGLYAAQSAEDGFVCLHMARQLRRLSPEELADVRKDYHDEPPDLSDYLVPEDSARDWERANPAPEGVGDQDYLRPDRLYQLACRQRPDPSAFQEWLEYCRSTNMSPASLERVTDKWVKAFPQDHRPWLALAQSAEERNAYNKALKYIAKAELLGSRDPATRVARMRLLIAKCVRHLKDEKLHLVPADLEALRALSQAREGDRSTFVDALEWVQAMMARNETRAAEMEAQIRNQLGGPLPATLLCLSVAEECGWHDAAQKPLLRSLSSCKNKELIQALVRVHPIGVDLNIEILIPSAWEKLLTKWFKRSNCSLEMNQLAIVAEAALTARWDELAYFCTNHGIRTDSTHLASFMLLRARSLPTFSDDRQQDCLNAALELARRHRQMDLVAEIVNTKRDLFDSPWGGFGFDSGSDEGHTMDEEALEEVLREERRLKKYPRNPFPARMAFEDYGPGVLNGSRRKKRKVVVQKRSKTGARDAQGYLFDDLFDEEEDIDIKEGYEDEDEDEDEGSDHPALDPSIMPPGLLELMGEVKESNHGKKNMTFSEFMRMVTKHPGVSKALIDMMNKTPGGRTR